MNIRKILGTLLTVMVFGAGNALAQEPNFIELTDNSGPVGGQVVWEIRYTDGGAPGSTLQFSMLFNDSVFALAAMNGCVVNNPGDWVLPTCVISGPGELTFATLDPPPGPVVGGGGDPTLMATVTFDIIGGPPGIYQVMVVPPIVVSDGEAVGTDPAILEVLGASYASMPTPPGPFNFGSLTMGVDPDGMLPLEISNDGQPGTTLNGSCSISGPGSAAFSQTPDNTFAVMQGGAADMSNIVCSSSVAVGNYTATLSCLHDGDSMPASPVEYDLSCNILAAPAPTYGSTPMPNTPFEFGTLTTDDPSPMQVLTIENVGNDDGLNGACSITTNPNMAYSIDTELNYGPLAQMATAMRTVTCDSSVLGDHTGGVLTCNALAPASNAGSFTYPLNCVVEPRPFYDSTPAPGMALPPLNGVQGNGDPVSNALTIVNTDPGEPGSTLNGSCTVMNQVGGDGNEIYIDSGSPFAVPFGMQTNIGVGCLSDEQGFYTANVVCTADEPNLNKVDEFTYPVECTIDPPDPAQYVSTPYGAGPPAAKIDINEGNDPPPVDGTPPSTVLTIMNGAPAGDDFLVLDDCEFTGNDAASDAAISTTPVLLNTNLDPGQSVNVTFNCSTAQEGLFTGVYTCPFDDDPSTPPPIGGPDGDLTSPVIYDVNCEVREQYSDVEESPPSGTPQSADLMPNESETWDFEFEEMLGEGLDGNLDSCMLAGDPAFGITTPTSGPIPSGGPPVVVTVEFNDPGQGDTFNTDLNCTFTDNPDGGEPEQTDVTWPITVNVTGRNATFLVTKDFNDDNPLGVEVFLECNTGLPLQQQAVIHDPDASGDLEPGDFTSINFVVVDFEPGSMDCDVWETVPTGYSESYAADFGQEGQAGSVFDDADGCHYEEIASSDFTCEITNTLDIVEVEVNKEWIDDNPDFQLPTWVEITLWCNEPIYFILGSEPQEAPGQQQMEGGTLFFRASQFIDPANPGLFGVFPHWDGSTFCFVTEAPEAGVDQDLSDCELIPLAPGQGGECTVVNTRLFAGIPTLSQYGLLLMALLMLGVGLAGFRRYA